MIRLLLNLPTLLFSRSLPSCAYGNFWNESIHMGRTRNHSIRTGLGLGFYQFRCHRIGKIKQRRASMQKILLLSSVFILISIQNIFAQAIQSVVKGPRPLWEGGLALISARVPAYPGANQYNTFNIPFPTFFYRGDYLRADEEGGMRTRFFKNKTFEMNLSIGGSLPANSYKNQTRKGMPNLKTLAQVGPGLLVNLWKKRGTANFKLGLNIPLRTAVAVDFWSLKEKGLVFNPLLYFITEHFLANKVFTFTALSSVIASQKFQRYFYQVDPRYATADRPQYQAHAGYLSSTISQGFSTQIYKDLMSFVGISYSYYKGAANFNSPLMKQDHNFSMAIGFVWWFYESDAKEQTRQLTKQVTQNQLLPRI